MNRKTFLLAALVLCLGFSFAPITSAQTPKKKPKLIAKADYDKRAVKRFAASFIKALDETKDLNEVPESFFVKDFKEHQALLTYNFLDYEEELRKLSVDARFDHQIAVFNLSYLGMMWNAGGEGFLFKEDTDNSEDDSDDGDNVDKIFPPDVIEALKRSPLTAEMFEVENNDKNRKETIEPAELIEATAAMQNAVRLLKIALDNRAPDWKTLYAKNIKSARKQFAGYGTENCDGQSCLGLPEKTPIFWQAAFPLCLHLVRENGRLKVFYIHLYTND